MPDIGEFLNEHLANEGGDEGTSEVVGAADLGANDDGAAKEDTGNNIPESLRPYVEKLRRESAGYRDKAKKFHEAFDGYEETAVEEWLEYVKGLRADPHATAKKMAVLSQDIIKAYEVNDEGEIQPEGTAASEGETARPLTMADYEKLRTAERAQDEQQSLARKVVADAEALGYEKGSRQYKILLTTAMELPDGSVHKAHEILKADRQSIIDSYVNEMRANGGRQLPPTGTATGQQETSIKTWADSRSSLEDFLAANQ